MYEVCLRLWGTALTLVGNHDGLKVERWAECDYEREVGMRMNLVKTHCTFLAGGVCVRCEVSWLYEEMI